MSVAADDAEAATTSEDSRNQHWVFTGNVHVRAETQGDLRADRATVEITNGALASADVSGSPAQFEQTRVTAGRLVKGHAAGIHYDVAAATIKLDRRCSADQRTRWHRHAQPVHRLLPARSAHRLRQYRSPQYAGGHDHRAQRAQRKAPPRWQSGAGKAVTDTLLSATHLAKSYRSRKVVQDLSLEVRAGEIVGLLGPNGAGKTTAFYMIVGLVPCDAGRITLGDEDLTFAPDAPAGPGGTRLSAAGAIGVPQAFGRRTTSWPSSKRGPT